MYHHQRQFTPKIYYSDVKQQTWKALTAATLSPIMEFTVDDFPTPPLPITRIVNVLTFLEEHYVKVNKQIDKWYPKKKKRTIIEKEIDTALRRDLVKKNAQTSCFSFPSNSCNLLLVAAGNCWIPNHSRGNWDAILLNSYKQRSDKDFFFFF